MRPSQRSRSRGRASQRSAEAGDIQPQASKAPSGDGELQAGPPPSSRAAKPTGSRPRWRQGTLPQAPGAAPEENQRESSKDKDKEGTTQPEPQREDKKGATQPEREDTEQEPQTEREDKDTQEKPEAPEEAPEDPEDPEDPEEEPETQPEDPEEVVPDSQPPWGDGAEQRAWQRSARRASASLQSRWELDSQL